MASDDLDPIFVKALKLLLSKSNDSIGKLKHLADEFIEQRKKEVAIEIASQAADADESNSYGFVGKSSMSKKNQQKADIKQEKEVERENLEKLQGNTDSLGEENPFGKGKERDQGLKIKAEPSEKPRERCYEIEEDIVFDFLVSSLASNKQQIVVDSEKDERVRDEDRELECREELNTSSILVDNGSDTEVSEDELQKYGLEDMQCDQELNNLSCIVCRTFDISSTNRLIECQECHSFYHQDCHKPPVTDNVNDPRFVWYCSNCAKILKKTVTKSITNKVKHPLPLNVREAPARKTSKIETIEVQQPFRRFEQFLMFSASKDNRKNSSTSGKGSGLSGLASVAASLSKSSSSLNSSKMSKSDTFSHLTQLGSSDHSAFTFGTVDAAGRFVDSKGSSLKTIGSNASASTSLPFKSEQEKSSGSAGSRGWSKTEAKRSGLNAAPNISTTKMPQSNLVNAVKRLQMMKKQAAKMNRKKSFSK